MTEPPADNPPPSPGASPWPSPGTSSWPAQPASPWPAQQAPWPAQTPGPAPDGPPGTGPQPYRDPPGWVPLPPPPPPMPEGFANRVTSGKSIASLVLGLSGLVGVLCHVTAPAALVGLVLGGLGLRETGVNGTRKGRGFAIAGLAICTLSLVVYATTMSALLYFAQQQSDQHTQREAAEVERDMKLVAERLKKYYLANGNSLGPGGVPPVLTEAEHKQPANAAAGMPGLSNGRVSGVLQISHLVKSGELRSVGRLERWTIQITSPRSAVITVNQRRSGVLAEAEVPNAATGEIIFLRR